MFNGVFQIGRLYIHDAMIEQNLTEKLKLFTSITAYVTGVTDISPSERHLLRGNVSEPLQGEQLLAGALKDGETYTAQQEGEFMFIFRIDILSYI